MRQQPAGERLHGGDPTDVGRLDRAGQAQPAAEGVAHAGVDRLGARRAARPQAPRLAQQGELQPVADEAGDLTVDHGRLLAARPHRLARPREHVRRGGGTSAHLDQRDQLRWVPEVGRDHPLTVLHALHDVARRRAARRCQHGRRRADPVELAEQLDLERHVMGDSLDHELRGRRVGEVGARADPVNGRVRICFGDQTVAPEVGQARVDVADRAVEALGRPSDHNDIQPRHGVDLADAVADDAVADDGNCVQAGGGGHSTSLSEAAEATVYEAAGAMISRVPRRRSTR